jgi:hypothetical protein
MLALRIVSWPDSSAAGVDCVLAVMPELEPIWFGNELLVPATVAASSRKAPNTAKRLEILNFRNGFNLNIVFSGDAFRIGYRVL